MRIHSSASSLIHGSEEISRKLRYFLNPTGSLYKFDDRVPRRPSPLTLAMVLMNCLMIVPPLIININTYLNAKEARGKSEKFGMIVQSRFLVQLSSIVEIYRILFISVTIMIVIARRSIMLNVFAANIALVNKREQTGFAQTAFAVFFIKTTCNIITYIFIVWEVIIDGGKISITNGLGSFVISPICLLWVNLYKLAPIILACYLGASLGQHVENFSKVYIDSMFDQFAKTTDMDNESVCEIPALKPLDHDSMSSKSGSLSWLDSPSVRSLLKGLPSNAGRRIIRMIKHLNANEYPELSGMKLTKISSINDIKITDTMRTANSHLVRVRLKKTQTMLCELRDVVSDINRMSSPLILLLFIRDTISITTIVTASIQAKLYKSLSLSMIPTMTSILSLCIGVVYICVCLDATTSQLKLLINKLFDFIILSHKTDPENEKRSRPVADGEGGRTQLSCYTEDEALSETWSQFQYTRKLAGTIHFTIGGILQVSRRLVLVILGHILSAVFIAIEVMSIVDTGNRERSGGSGAVVSAHNNTSG